MSHAGRLVAFEGIDCAGKSTVIAEITKIYTASNVLLEICREYDSPLAPLIRGEALKKLTPFQKTFFFAADRAWTYENRCLPALRRGALVLWDRYKDSAHAYRAVDLSIRSSELFNLEFVKAINKPFQVADRTFLIDIDVETSRARSLANGSSEPYNVEFLERVRAEYHSLASAGDYAIVDGARPVTTVAAEVAAKIRSEFPQLFK